MLGTLLKLAAKKIATAAKTIAKSMVETVKPSKAILTTAERESNKNITRETIETAKSLYKKPTPAKNVPINDSNEVFKFLLRNAGDPMLSPYDPGDVSGFFSLTKYIWDKPGISLDKRLDAIQDFFNAPLDVIFEGIIKSDEYMEYLEDLFTGEQYTDIRFSPFMFAGDQVLGVML